MKFNEESFVRIYRLIRPEPRKWIIRASFGAGIPLISTPLWEPYLRAILAQKYNINVQLDASYAGWILISIGLIMILVNHYIDSKPKFKVLSEEDKSDRKNLVSLFNEIHIPTMDLFFEQGKLSMTYIPAIHFLYGIEGVFKSSSFHIHDLEIKNKAQGFYDNLKRSLSFAEYFTETSSPELQKFDSRFNIHSDSVAAQAKADFTRFIIGAEVNLKELCSLICSKYPDFNFSETNKKALDDYKYHHSMVENMVSGLQFSLMEIIVELEGRREAPTLQRLAQEASKPTVDVQVAMNKLIKKGFAHHLYKGMPHQKYTLSDEGREYFIDNRDG